jgi:putative SOS response-associated peptidase YedK
MCNDYEQQIAWAEYCALMQALELHIPTRQSELDLTQAADIHIQDMAPIMRATAEPSEVELAQMRWGFSPPAGRKTGPVFNFRSEGRSFADSRRCVIPASAFFEFTGSTRPKIKHRFTLNGAPFMGIAGLWRPGEGNQPAAFTMLTMEPGPDVAPIHNRQIAVLRPNDWSAWLWLTKTEGELLKPLPAGSLSVAAVDRDKAPDQLL